MTTHKYIPAATNLPMSTQLKHVENFLFAARDTENETLQLVEDINSLRVGNHRKIIDALRYKKSLLAQQAISQSVSQSAGSPGAASSNPSSALDGALQALQVPPEVLNAIKVMIHTAMTTGPPVTPPQMSPPSELPTRIDDESMSCKRNLEADFVKDDDAISSLHDEETPFVPCVAPAARNMVDPDLDDIIPMVPTKRIRGRVDKAEKEAAIEPETPCTHVPDPENSD